jgi:hypothetical protein
MNADVFLLGFIAGTWATCLTILAVLEIRYNRNLTVLKKPPHLL